MSYFEKRIFAHDPSCPAAGQDPAARLLAMAAGGTCNCWHEPLTRDLELYGIAILRRRIGGEIERVDPRRTLLHHMPEQVSRALARPPHEADKFWWALADALGMTPNEVLATPLKVRLKLLELPTVQRHLASTV